MPLHSTLHHSATSHRLPSKDVKRILFFFKNKFKINKTEKLIIKEAILLIVLYTYELPSTGIELTTIS